VLALRVDMFSSCDSGSKIGFTFLTIVWKISNREVVQMFVTVNTVLADFLFW
jgi:hypothetical protein